MAPLLEKQLGVKCIMAKNFDTDTFGTFTGEIDRKEDPISTARSKCLDAMCLSGCDAGIASEGSFGPHPAYFFIYAGDEILVFIDKKNGIEITARELSTETNFNAAVVSTQEALLHFAEQAKFPSHALILRKAKDDTSGMIKGITERTRLITHFHQLLADNGSAYVETDMRAMYNPTRMIAIEKATQKLIDKIKSCCPLCNTPGFGITEAKPGLPCSICGSPTQSTLSFIYSCMKCLFNKEEMYPGKKLMEEPMYCDYCNP